MSESAGLTSTISNSFEGNNINKIATYTLKMTLGRAILLDLIAKYLTGLMEPYVSLLEIHKLMYFMQEAGQPLNLRFQKAHYGPYANNLRHVLIVIDGHFIEGYVDSDSSDRPYKPIELKREALTKAQGLLEVEREAQQRIAQVQELIHGFETPFGLELLASVHWLMKYEDIRDIQQLSSAMQAWNKHKALFEPEHLELAWQTIRSRQWLQA